MGENKNSQNALMDQICAWSLPVEDEQKLTEAAIESGANIPGKITKPYHHEGQLSLTEEFNRLTVLARVAMRHPELSTVS